ncbi:hypothetical protein N9N67_12090, partial [Bacteriovoracaceae bacterium]|nr:hypothetical protein [Bacteriovoracaceae bacterium]
YTKVFWAKKEKSNMRAIISLTTILSLVLVISSCGFNNATKMRERAKKKEERKAKLAKKEGGKITEQKSSSQNKLEDEVQKIRESYSIQITTINFLTGGQENSGVRNKIFEVNLNDKMKKTIISKNSKISVEMLSNNGLIIFQAINQSTKKVLEKGKGYPAIGYFKLGSDNSIRIRPANPYGFTWLSAEDMTGFDPTLLARFNDLSTRRSKLFEKTLLDGNANENDREQLKELDSQISEVSKQMYETRKK